VGTLQVFFCGVPDASPVDFPQRNRNTLGVPQITHEVIRLSLLADQVEPAASGPR
jgi:hypothetical protein